MPNLGIFLCLISYIIGPASLSEHQPHLPSDGAWLWVTVIWAIRYNQIIDAVTKGESANDTVILISYDGELLLVLLHVPY